MRAIRPVSLLMLSLLALAGCNKPAEQAAAPAATSGEQVIKLGHASPMTGPIAHIGKDTEYGAQIAVDELNGEGFTHATIWCKPRNINNQSIDRLLLFIFRLF